ncbi:LysR family transcriptional regulator [Pannonibacter phragmitetus]|uniref:LysR family transcriptional regulator n=1 Tax=Pannonibacter phragmitetus TaxID=121719 RepID=UPI000B96F70D|nr:LysR family transcriptional regulator [Pannonibacter phragmitetus]
MSAFSREIRSFIVVSQSDSIRAAAERLNISAPALGRQMLILERSYGAPLLVRSTSGVALTAAGEELRNQALRWMEADTNFSQRLQQTKLAMDLRLRMGVMEGLVPTLVHPLMDRLEAVFGVVELELTVGTTRDIIDRAEALDLDLIVAFNMPRLSRLAVVQSEEYHLGVVYAPGSGPEGEGPVSLSEALQWPLCLPSAALSMHTRLLAEILSVRVNPRVRFNSNSIGALLNMLRRGKGIGFLTWIDVCADVEAGNLVFRPLASRRLTETLSVTICRGNSLGDATGPVLAEISALLASLGK